MNKIIIAYDLFLDLKLYQIPEKFIKEFQEKNLKYEFIPYDPLLNTTNNDISIYWGNRINMSIVDKLPNLKWIHFGSVGINKIDLDCINKRKIIVTNSAGIMTNAVANHAIMFLLMLSRNMHHAINLRSENILNRNTFDKYFESTTDLENYNCIILGNGLIAKKIQSICIALGLNAECISRSTGNKLNNINNLLSNKQFIINSLPLNPETKNLIDLNFFKKMNNNSYFINIGRGETVIENDLIYALKNGIIAGAALDVFNIEPLSESSELWSLNNVIITPHIAGVTNNYWKKQCDLFVTNLNNFIYHKPMINQSNI